MDPRDRLALAELMAWAYGNAGQPVPDRAVGLLQSDDQWGELAEAFDRGHSRGMSARTLSQAAVAPRNMDGWIGEPIPLPNRAPIPEMVPDLLPGPLRPWLVDSAQRACIPLECFAIPAIVGLASVVGRHAVIRPEEQSSWSTPPNLWGAIVAGPGLMKSHAIGVALAPVKVLAEDAAEDHERDERRNEIEKIATKAEIDALKRRASVNRTELESLMARYHAQQQPERRYTTSDPTVEKLGILMNENPRGILLIRDELSGWLDAMRKQGREGDRSFYLEAWGGDSSYTVDRVGRGTLRIASMCLSVIGAIQPGRIQQHVAGAVSGGQDADGLLQRVQLLVWPDTLPEWRRCSGEPDEHAREIAHAVYAILDCDFRERHEEPVRFDRDAQRLYDDYRDGLETLLRSGDIDSCPAYGAHIAKYKGLVPSLALLFWLAEGNRPPRQIGAAYVAMALAWKDYLNLHARKVYDAELDLGVSSAKALARRIREGHIEHQMPIRDVRRAQWSGLKTTQQITEAIGVLEIYNWAHRVSAINKDGRVVNEIHLHPSLRDVTRCQ